MDSRRMHAAPPASLICAECEYALRGTASDGRCPECGLEVEESIRVAGLWTPKRLRQLRVVVVTLGIVWATWSAMGIAFLFPPVLWLRLTFVVAMLVHAGAAVTVAMLGVHATSRRRRSERRALLGLLAGLTALPVLVLVAAILRIVTPSDTVINGVLIGTLVARGVLLWFAVTGLAQAAQTLHIGRGGLWRIATSLLALVTGGWVVGLGLPLLPMLNVRNSDLVLGGLMTVDALLLLAITVLGVGVFRAASARLRAAAAERGP